MYYTVYENRRNKRARVHEATCHQIRKGGGEHPDAPLNGQYHEGFETSAAAWNKAISIGSTEWDVDICFYCRSSNSMLCQGPARPIQFQALTGGSDQEHQ